MIINYRSGKFFATPRACFQSFNVVIRVGYYAILFRPVSITMGAYKALDTVFISNPFIVSLYYRRIYVILVRLGLPEMDLRAASHMGFPSLSSFLGRLVGEYQ